MKKFFKKIIDKLIACVIILIFAICSIGVSLICLILSIFTFPAHQYKRYFGSNDY